MSYPNKIVKKTEKREEILLKVLRKEIGKRQCSEPLSRGYMSEKSGLEKKHVDYAVKCLVKKHLVSFYDTADGKVFYLGFKNQNFLQKAKRFREKFRKIKRKGYFFKEDIPETPLPFRIFILYSQTIYEYVI